MKRQYFLSRYFIALLFLSFNVIADSRSSISASIGYDQTTGDYGQANETEITTVPVSLQLIKGSFRYKVVLPYTSVTGDGSVLPNSIGGMWGGFGGGSSSSTVETQSGLGDISTSISYALKPENSHNFYELTAEIKWGTASTNKNLGTGENDYSLIFYSQFGRNNLKPFISLGYVVTGDTATQDYNDSLFASTGLTYQFNRDTSIRLTYDHQQASVDNTDDGQSWSIAVSNRLSQKWGANLYLSEGLSDTAADTGFGFSLNRYF